MTKEISIEKLLNCFTTTLGRFDCIHLDLPDDELLYIILEELDIETITFLHINAIEKLAENNLIPRDIVPLIENLRDRTMKLLKDKRSIYEIRNDTEWKAVRELAIEIKNEIRIKNIVN